MTQSEYLGDDRDDDIDDVLASYSRHMLCYVLQVQREHGLCKHRHMESMQVEME